MVTFAMALDATLGAACIVVVDVATRFSPSLGGLLDWSFDSLGPLVPEWAI